MSYLDLVDEINNLLQGYETDCFNSLERTSQKDEKRRDPYKVTVIEFKTEYNEAFT